VSSSESSEATAAGALPTASSAVGAQAAGAAHEGEVQRLLFDHISDAVFATDSANRVTHWTASAERLFGYSADEAVGRLFDELLPFRMAEPGGERAFFATLEAGRTWRGTGTVRLRDDREIWLESSVQPIIVDGRLAGSVSVSRDISETIEAQRRLADRERFLDAILDVAGALVVVLDASGRVVRFNSACERLSGYTSAEVVGRQLWDVVIPETEVDEVRAVAASLQAGAFPNSHENHWVTRSGALSLVSWENTCLTDVAGAVTHVIATGVDITDARRGDEALHGIETVGRLLAEQGPIPAALDAVLGELEARMGYVFLSLYLRDGPGLRLGARRGYRALPEYMVAELGVIGRVFRTGRGELVRDARSDPDYVPGDPSVVAEIAVPLLGDDGTIGVLNIESAQPRALSQTDLRLARAIADRLASALLRNREQAALRERMRLFAALTDFAGVVNAILEPARLLAALVDAVGAVIPSDTLVITMLDRSDGQYRISAVRGLREDVVGAIVELGEGAIGRAILERVVVSTGRLPRARYPTALRDRTQYDELTLVAVPLIREDTVLGAIAAGRAGRDASFSDTEREVIALLGSHAALAVANADLMQEVSALVIHDGLSGLYNRRHFDAALDLAIARWKRRGPTANLAAIMFDLDHFGDFNRLYGHLAGDAVLRLFGGILRERLRSADLIARYGGEEFIVILEDCPLPEAVERADEIRRELEARPVSGVDGRPLHATVSAGCALLDPADPSRETLIGRADVGLVMAKRAGRNQVVAA